MPLAWVVVRPAWRAAIPAMAANGTTPGSNGRKSSTPRQKGESDRVVTPYYTQAFWRIGRELLYEVMSRLCVRPSLHRGGRYDHSLRFVARDFLNKQRS